MPKPTDDLSFAGWTASDLMAAMVIELRKLVGLASGVGPHAINDPTATADDLKSVAENLADGFKQDLPENERLKNIKDVIKDQEDENQRKRDKHAAEKARSKP